MSKRTLDGFFSATPKRPRKDVADTNHDVESTTASTLSSDHSTYPWPMPHLPRHMVDELELLVTAEGKTINDQPHLDLVYYQPFIPKSIERELFEFLRSELFFYRVQYTINKFGKATQINTPRFTTVFGLDETSCFVDNGTRIVEANAPTQTIKKNKYNCNPRPIPQCLDLLRRVTEANTNAQYNFCLVNYYASGDDSISFHSDDERFLGPNPAIASFTLGARRDFMMKHKPPKPNEVAVEAKPVKMPLGSGDMVLMRGPTQAHWLHSIPKRKGADADRGRINITLRRAMIPYGTMNYYQYNVGSGQPFKWDASKRQMVPWTAPT